MHVIPIIRPADYETFRSILNNEIPDTYEEWVQNYAKVTQEFLARSEPHRGVQVDPHEFIRFCRSCNAVPGVESLGEFAVEKASGNHY